ncbi:hypothetical protein CLOP_g11757 [Closterium sp. NIES-67]|nr:hypothetical protein CLOP_g11757 [Closterium sp. NIES-67]
MGLERYGVGVPEAVTVEVGVKIRRVSPGGERYDAIAVGSSAVGDEVQHEDTGLQEGTTDEEAALPVMLKSALGNLLEWKQLVGLLLGKREGGCS